MYIFFAGWYGSTVCEQTFSWLSHGGKIFRHMNQHRSMLYIVNLCVLRNRKVEKNHITVWLIMVIRLSGAVWSKITSLILGVRFSKVLTIFFLPKKPLWFMKLPSACFQAAISGLQKPNDTEVSLFLSDRGNYKCIWRKSVSIKKY